MWHTLSKGPGKQKAGVVYRFCRQVVKCDTCSDDAVRAKSEPCCQLQDPTLYFCSASPSFLSVNSSLGLLIFYFPVIVAAMAEGPSACPQISGFQQTPASAALCLTRSTITVFCISASASFLYFLRWLSRFPLEPLFSPPPPGRPVMSCFRRLGSSL